jgi:hypothetical protein
MMALLVLGDIVLRAVFFNERTTSFQTEMARARQERLASGSARGFAVSGGGGQ